MTARVNDWNGNFVKNEDNDSYVKTAIVVKNIKSKFTKQSTIQFNDNNLYVWKYWKKVANFNPEIVDFVFSLNTNFFLIEFLIRPNLSIYINIHYTYIILILQFLLLNQWVKRLTHLRYRTAE